MLIGTVKEIKNHEYRVGLTPEAVNELARRGHRVLIEAGAGVGIRLSQLVPCENQNAQSEGN